MWAAAILLLTCCWGQEVSWTHTLNLGRDGEILLLWVPQETSIVFEVRARTHGYVGVGFSRHGGMAGADIALGWVTQDGQVNLQDYYAVTNSRPSLDPSQDYKLLGGYENDTHTVIQFRRKWDTCDEEHDMKLGVDTVRVIWAYSDRDPEDDNLVWHGLEYRGTRSVHLNAPATPKLPTSPDIKHWDITMENKTIPAELDTLYWCKIVKAPQLDRKHHVVGFLPLIHKGNEAHIHHFILYECIAPSSSQVFDKYLQKEGAECYSHNMPIDWNHCITSIFTWAVGSEGEMFPDHFGQPLGEEHSGATYFMMEMHYDNPTFRKFTDNSGIRIFYTDQLRENDGSVLFVGHRVLPLHFIPPEQDNFVTHAYCPGQCTSRALPEEGIKLYSVLLHAHTAGSKLRLRHLRNGKELDVLAADDQYDFNYQQGWILPKEVTFLPGDELLTECSYNTSARENPTFGGASTRDEMCMAFITYYPRVSLSRCQSIMTLQSFFHTLGIKQLQNINLDQMNVFSLFDELHTADTFDIEYKTEDDMRTKRSTPISFDSNAFWEYLQVKEPPQLSNLTMNQIFKKQPWHDKQYVKYVEDEWRRGKYNVWCSVHGRKDIVLEPQDQDYPMFEELPQPESISCDIETESDLSQGVKCHWTSWLIVTSISVIIML